MQLVGLNSCHAGAPLPKGVKDAGATALLKALTKITQPYNGGVTFNFSNPTSNKFHREGETDPFFSLRDVTSGSKEITWNIADFDDATMEFYFGTTEAAKGELYEGEKSFVRLQIGWLSRFRAPEVHSHPDRGIEYERSASDRRFCRSTCPRRRRCRMEPHRNA